MTETISTITVLMTMWLFSILAIAFVAWKVLELTMRMDASEKSTHSVQFVPAEDAKFETYSEDDLADVTQDAVDFNVIA